MEKPYQWFRYVCCSERKSKLEKIFKKIFDFSAVPVREGKLEKLFPKE